MLKGATPVISVFILGGAGKPKNISSLRDILRKNCTIALIGEQQFFSQCENPDFALVEIENLSRITAPNAIILCKEPFEVPNGVLRRRWPAFFRQSKRRRMDSPLWHPRYNAGHV